MSKVVYIVIFVIAFSIALVFANQDSGKIQKGTRQPTEAEVQEMRIQGFYAQANREILAIIAKHYYSKGWSDGWDGCARQQFTHEGVSNDAKKREAKKRKGKSNSKDSR